MDEIIAALELVLDEARAAVKFLQETEFGLHEPPATLSMQTLITIPIDESEATADSEALLLYACASCGRNFEVGDRVLVEDGFADQTGCYHESCTPSTQEMPTAAAPTAPATKKKPRSSGPKNEPSILPTLELLEKAYMSLVSLFTGATRPSGEPLEVQEAERPVIVINSPGRSKNVLGHLAPNRWKNGDSSRVNELAIISTYLDRGALAVMETLLHEMVHHFNAINGVKDVTGNQYHNKAFLRLATHIGLKVERMETPKRGWAATSYTPELEAEVKKRVFLGSTAEVRKWDKIFKLCHAGFPVKEKAPTKMKKWTCRCRPKPVIVRAAVQIDVTCNVCGKKFQKDAEREAASLGLVNIA